MSQTIVRTHRPDQGKIIDDVVVRRKSVVSQGTSNRSGDVDRVVSLEGRFEGRSGDRQRKVINPEVR